MDDSNNNLISYYLFLMEYLKIIDTEYLINYYIYIIICLHKIDYTKIMIARM